MRYRKLHDWNVSRVEAVEIQKRLRDQVKIQPLDRPVNLVAGCDISFNKFSDVIYAGIVVLKLPGLEVIDRAAVETRTEFPYIPGLLSFREMPALLEAWEKLSVAPDIIMLDGQGLAHPRRFGIACHAGLLTDTPSLGCGKTVLVGNYNEPDERAGSYSPMTHKGETIGAALRTRDRVTPVYISPGHLIDLPGAVEVALRCVRGYPDKPKYRIPEPTRLAHLFVNTIRRGEATDAALA